MPDPVNPPDDATIDAWLSGELSHEDAAGLEAYFSKNPPSEEQVPEALRSLDQSNQTDTQVSGLLDLINSKSPPPSTRMDAETLQTFLSPSEKEEVLGLLGQYEIHEIISSGNMSTVLRAWDPELNRLAAIKILSPDLTGNPTARARFLREARAAAALEHDNILPLYSVHNDPLPWFAMRFVSGGTLQDALDLGESFSLQRLKNIAAQVASALSTSHKSGLVHRDIKPANILLEEDSDRIWVCDFGIARSISDPSLTYAGHVAGTPLYMSPEQAAGVLLDGRSDLFSLGSVLYHCATGTFPFAGETSAAVLQNVSTSVPPNPRSLNRALPAWFERFLSKLLQKDPAERFHDADAVIAALESEHTALSKKKIRQRIALLTLATTSVLVVGLLQIPFVRNLTNQALIGISSDSITIENKIGTYPDLASAIEKARPGDTITLHGDQTIPIDIVTIPEDKPLTLQAARNSSPILENSGPNAHLKSLSSLKIIGLTFRSHKMGRTSPGCLTLVGKSNEIRDCTFEASSKPLNVNSAGRPATISLKSHANMLIDGCTFQLSEVAVVSVWDTRSEEMNPTPRHLQFANSILTGSRSVTIIRVDSSVGVKLSYQDCLVSTDCVVMDYWNMDLKPVHILSQNTIFAPQHAYLWASREPSKSSASLIQWHSKNDLFRLHPPFFSNALILPKPTKRATLVPLWMRWSQNPKGSLKGGKILDFPFPGHEPDLNELQKVLRDSGTTSAIKTLQKLNKKS